MKREQLAKVPHEIVRKNNEAARVKHRKGKQRSQRSLGERNKSVRGGGGGGGEREREEAGEKLRSVPIEVKKEQENKAAEPTNRRQSGQDSRKMSDQKIGRRDGKEKWRRRRGDSERKRRPGGNKR